MRDHHHGPFDHDKAQRCDRAQRRSSQPSVRFRMPRRARFRICMRRWKQVRCPDDAHTQIEQIRQDDDGAGESGALCRSASDARQDPRGARKKGSGRPSATVKIFFFAHAISRPPTCSNGLGWETPHRGTHNPRYDGQVAHEQTNRISAAGSIRRTRLVAGLCRGEAGCYRQLYDRFAPRVQRLLLRIFADPQLARDAVQSTFLIVF